MSIGWLNMPTDRIRTDMIELYLDGIRSSFQDIIEQYQSIPITAFDSANGLVAAVHRAIEFLRNQKCGSVYINESGGFKEVILNSRLNKDGFNVINFSTYNYRYPINNESRPYTKDDWQLGDIILNTDINANRVAGWICIEAGTPGNWKGFGYLRDWYTEVERVDRLPEASEVQEGRQVICSDSKGVMRVWCCMYGPKVNDDGTVGEDRDYQWVSQVLFDYEIEGRLPEVVNELWEDLMHQLDVNLLERITPVLTLYFEKNPVVVFEVSAYDTQSNSWGITGLKNVDSFDSLPNEFSIVVKIPLDSKDNEIITILGNDFSVYSTIGIPISEGELKSGIVTTFNVDKNSQRIYVAGGSVKKSDIEDLENRFEDFKESASEAISNSGGVIVSDTEPEGNPNKLWVKVANGVAHYWDGSNWIAIKAVFGA